MISSNTFSYGLEQGTLPKEETLNLRQKHIPKACALHYEKSPLKVTRAFGQYLYDDTGIEYLDCVNCVAHVGHCNPAVVNAGKIAMLQMGCVSYGMTDTAREYVNKLKLTFPPELDTFLFVSSGSEANDLALQLARLSSNGHDVVAVEGSFHGSLSETFDISSRQTPSAPPYSAPGWAHIIPCPDQYRGRHNESDPMSAEKYVEDAKEIIDAAVENGHKIACFICEPVMTIAGVIVPPPGWMASVYEKIRSLGGLCIADETQSGLGRSGLFWWGFQSHGVVPDIVTIGKPIGNGHPMALVVTSSRIASKLRPDVMQSFNCDHVVAAIGLAVLNSIRSENLLKNARDVGSFLREGLRALAADHPNIGHVRGLGLIMGIEIVTDRVTRTPASEIAERICYRMKEKHMLVGNEGIHKNVLLLTPPMCFTCENAHRVLVNISSILEEIEKEERESGSVRLEENVTSNRLISLGVFDEPLGDAFILNQLNTSGHDFLALD